MVHLEKIVKRGQKLMVEKFEGRHHYSCSHTSHSVCKFQGGVVSGKAKAEVLNVCE